MMAAALDGALKARAGKERRMNQKDEALRVAAKAFLIIRFGGTLTANEAKMFCDLCCLALPMKYRFEKQELVNIEAGVRRTLDEQEDDSRNDSYAETDKPMSGR